MINTIRIFREYEGPNDSFGGSLKKGGTRKIADLPKQKTCRHPEHNPAGHIVREPGVYEHECPGCGNTSTFIVNERPTLASSKL